VLQKVDRSLVDLLGVARDFLVEDARPDEGVELELWCHAGDSMDEKVIVKVLANCEEIVVQLFNLLVPPEYLDVFHLAVDHGIEGLNKLFFELVGELVA